MEISQSDLDRMLKDAYNNGYQKALEIDRQVGYNTDSGSQSIKAQTITSFPASIQKFTGNLEGF